MLRSAVADVESNVDVFTDAILLKAVGLLRQLVFASSSAIVTTALTVACCSNG